MTLPRTVRRREKRQRAKALIMQRAAEWATLSPEERKRREAWRDMFTASHGLFLAELKRNLSDLRFVSGRMWNREYR